MEALNVEQILNYQLPKLTPIIDNALLYPATRLFLYGSQKSLKSMLAVDMAFSIAMGTSWLGYKTKRSRVLYVQMELPLPMFKDRLVQYCQGMIVPDNLYFLCEPKIKLDRSSGLEALENVLAVTLPDVLIIDPLYKIISGDISSHQPVNYLQDNLDGLRDKYRMALVIVCHTRQAQLDREGNPIDQGSAEIMGSSNWPNWADATIRVRREGEFSPDVTLSFQDMRYATEEMYPVRASLIMENLHWKVLGVREND